MTVDNRTRLERLFDNHLTVGLHHGAQLAVYTDGELVVDRAGGVAEPGGKPLAPRRRMVFFSCTKPLTAACVHHLIESGELAYDDTIREYWPAFAEPGTDKAEITVRHVLSHQGGFPFGPFDARPDRWTDWEAAVAAMEDIDLSFEPGSTAAYHALNYGWVLGELVRRVSGERIGEYLQTHVLDPLGMDETYLGLPDAIQDDVATLVGFEEFDRAREPDVEFGSNRGDAAANFNQEAFHRAEMPAANAVGTARDLARFYACLANGGELDGVRILEPETVEAATDLQIAVAHDDTIGGPRRYAMGFHLAGTPTDSYGSLAPPSTFGHGGLGSSISWADPDIGLAMAYVTNGIRDGYEQRARANEIGDAVRRTFAG